MKSLQPKPWLKLNTGSAWLILIIALGLGLRLAHCLVVHDHLLLQPRGFLDDVFYDRFARAVAGGDLLAGREVFFLSPLYIYFLGLVYFIFSPGPAAPFLIQSLLGAAAVWLCFRAGTMLKDARAGLLAAALIAFDGLAVMFESSLLQASLDPFLSALFFFALVKAVVASRISSWLLLGFAAGLLSLNRPNALVLLPLCPALALWFKGGNAWKSASAAALAGIIVLLPVTLRNLAVGGDAALVSSHGGMNFYIGNRQGADGFYEPPEGLSPDMRAQAEEARLRFERELGRPVMPSEVSRRFYSRAFDEIKADPAGWLTLLGRKALYLANSREAGLNLSLSYLKELSPALRLSFVGMWLIIPLAGLGAASELKSRAAQAVMVASLAYAATVVLFFVSDRYRLPLHVPLALLAGAGMSSVVERVRARHWKRLIAPLAVLVALAFVSQLRLEIPSGAGQMRLSHCLRLIDAGRIEEAKELAAGMPVGEMNPFFWRVKLAAAYSARGAPEEAVEQYRFLVGLAPDEAELRCRLAEALMSAGDREAAISELKKGLSLDPFDPGCQEALSEIRLRPR